MDRALPIHIPAVEVKQSTESFAANDGGDGRGEAAWGRGRAGRP